MQPAGYALTARHRADGGAVVSAAATDRRTGDPVAVDAVDNVADVWTATLAAVAEPTVVDVTWTVDGTDQLGRPVTVVDGAPLVDPDKVPAAGNLDRLDVDEVVAAAVGRIEVYTGWWPVRWHRQDLPVRPDCTVRPTWHAGLPAAPIVTVTAVDAAGQPVTVSDVAAEAGIVLLGPEVSHGDTVTVDVEFGLGLIPADLADAAMQAARQQVREEVNQHRAKRAEYADGVSWTVTTPSPAHDRLFGIPDLDAVFWLHQTRSLVVAG